MAYVQPDAAALKLRFPAFAAVDDTVVNYWLTDARLTVTDAWIEADRAPAEMELAAHNMAVTGVGAATGPAAALASLGITEFQSGSRSASFDATVSRESNSGAYGSTKYGAMFLRRLARNFGGPQLMGCV